MTFSELKKIIISSLKDGWIITDDNKYYIKEVRESDKSDLESVLSDIENNTISGLEFIRDMIDEYENLL